MNSSDNSAIRPTPPETQLVVVAGGACDGRLSRAMTAGLSDVTRRNSRLKFDFVWNPESNIAAVTDISVSRNSRQASPIRQSLMYCETFLRASRLMAPDICLAGMPARRASRASVKFSSRNSFCSTSKRSTRPRISRSCSTVGEAWAVSVGAGGEGSRALGDDRRRSEKEQPQKVGIADDQRGIGSLAPCKIQENRKIEKGGQAERYGGEDECPVGRYGAIQARLVECIGAAAAKTQDDQ